jgi:predicted amino acid-binding ACT domain protein
VHVELLGHDRVGVTHDLRDVVATVPATREVTKAVVRELLDSSVEVQSSDRALRSAGSITGEREYHVRHETLE